MDPNTNPNPAPNPPQTFPTPPTEQTSPTPPAGMPAAPVVDTPGQPAQVPTAAPLPPAVTKAPDMGKKVIMVAGLVLLLLIVATLAVAML